MTAELARDLPLLFALDAAPEHRIREGHLERVSLALLERDLIGHPPPSVGSWSDFTMLSALVASFRRGHVARDGLAWCLTAYGREQLRTAGLEPGPEAQRLAAEFART